MQSSRRVNFSCPALSCGAALFIPVSRLCASPARVLQSNPSSPLPPTKPLRKHILPAPGSASPPSSEVERSSTEEMQRDAVSCVLNGGNYLVRQHQSVCECLPVSVYVPNGPITYKHQRKPQTDVDPVLFPHFISVTLQPKKQTFLTKLLK